MTDSVQILQPVLILFKALALLTSLVLFGVTAGWLKGADILLFPGVGLVIATPLLVILLAVVEVVLVIACGVLSAIASTR